MEKLWLNQYEHGVPHEINPDSYNSLIDLIEEKYQEYNNKIAYSNMGHGITYSELNILSTAFAAYLQNTLKLKVGDRVAIMMPNVLQYPVALFGILRAGLTVVNVNPLYTPTELKHILQDSGVKAILVLSNFANTVQKVLPAIPDLIVIVTSIGDLFPFIKKNIINFVVKYIKKKVPDWNIPGHIDFNALIEKGKQLNYYKPVINNQHIAFLQYTGGTTGVSKGAMLTHRNMLANLMQAKAWVSPILQSKKSKQAG